MASLTKLVHEFGDVRRRIERSDFTPSDEEVRDFENLTDFLSDNFERGSRTLNLVEQWWLRWRAASRVRVYKARWMSS